VRGLALALVLAPQVADACTCIEIDYSDALEAAEIVAEVVILDVNQTEQDDDFPVEWVDSGYFATAEVRRIWKGRGQVAWEKGRARLGFVGHGDGAMCGYGPGKPGTMHILFLHTTDDTPWSSTGLCSGSASHKEGMKRIRSALGPGWLPTPTGWVEGPGCASCATTEPTSLDAFWFGLLLLLRPRRSPNALSFPSTTTYPSSRQFAGTRRLRSRASRSRGRHP
jgi:hypothetical protein